LITILDRRVTGRSRTSPGTKSGTKSSPNTHFLIDPKRTNGNTVAEENKKKQKEQNLIAALWALFHLYLYEFDPGEIIP
jgi:hypothetical protein